MTSIRNFQQPEEEHQTIKPAIKTFLLLFNAFILVSIFYFMILGLLLGPILGILFFNAKISGIIITACILIFLIFIMISYFLQKAVLERTEYRFYSDRLEYYEGFLVRNRKTISYDKITNVGQRKGIFESLFELGTIFIDTPGSSPRGHEVTISYLENPDQVYDWLCKVTSNKK